MTSLGYQMFEETRFLTSFRTDSYSPMSSALIGQTELTEEAVKAIHEATQGAVSTWLPWPERDMTWSLEWHSQMHYP